MSKKDQAGEKHRERELARRNAASRSVRDIGPCPDIANVTRRSRCRKSLRLFCETYNADAFCLRWSSDHQKVIQRIEEAVFHGLLSAFATPRGSGKTSICRHAALWAISYGLVRYAFVIGANSEKAQDTLAAIRTYIRFLPIYAADFPEISFPVIALGGISNRASGQLCQGKSTLIEWSKDRIFLPTVPPPSNWPKSWKLRADGMVPTSGSVISVSGLTGDGIRGSLITLSTGESLRPDLVLLDDPQSAESARSPAQNQTREQLVSADVLGMAGPGKAISAVMPCTVIAQGDFVDRILDRSKHPLWRGERTKMLRALPANLAPWDAYFELYQAGAQREPPDFAEANAYYRAHQAVLEEGAEASWPERKLPGEISAIQHAMHLYCRDRAAFMSEYQNDPIPLVPPLPGELTADEISRRLNRYPRRTVPPGSTQITAFVDVQQDLLWWAAVAWEEGFGGAVVDYGAWPDQRRNYFTLADANPTISQATGMASLEGSLWAALSKLGEKILEPEWEMAATGSTLRVERCLVDSGWGMSTEAVKRWCRQGSYSSVALPSKGIGIGASSNPMAEWPRKPGERRGLNWLMPPIKPGEGRMVLFDANSWKSFVAFRLAQAMGERGGLVLFGESAAVHRMIADHCTSEYRVRTTGRGRTLDEWKQRPHRPDNHLWDCLVGCAVAASISGVNLPGLPKAAGTSRRSTTPEDAARRREEFMQRRGY